MTALPAATDFTGAAVTEAGFKTAITDMRTFLADLLGTSGTEAAALAAMGSILGAGYSWRTAAFTVTAADRGVFFACNGTFTISLPSCATVGAGFAIAVRNHGSGTITLDPSGSETIDGAATLALGAATTCFLVSDGGAAWLTVGRTVVLPLATASNNGQMSASYASKLDGVAWGANVGVPYDTGNVAVGTMLIVGVTGSVTINAGVSTAGSNLGAAMSNGNAFSTYGSLPGNWRNISGAQVSTGYYTTFQRIS